MVDLFGHAKEREPFRDIRDQRDAVAEEKAVLCKQLGELVRIVPASVRTGSIQMTRQWMHDQARASKVLRSPRSSRFDLQSAIQSMRSYEAA